MISQVAAYFRKLTLGDSKESSKRFIALSCMILASYVVIRFADSKNCEVILAELLSFILMILGVASWQNVRKFEHEIKQKNQGENEDLLDNT